MWKIGIDEAGRGPWAGPVFAAVVILTAAQEEKLKALGVNDSKKLTEKKRTQLFKNIVTNSSFYKVKYLSAPDIDKIGIYKSTQFLIQELTKEIITFFKQNNLAEECKVLIDGTFPGLELIVNGQKIAHECIIKGDSKEIAIGSASILAKVKRDLYMENLQEKYPEYLFEKHKGYGTKAHTELLSKHGPCPEHRRSFKPVADTARGFGLTTK